MRILKAIFAFAILLLTFGICFIGCIADNEGRALFHNVVDDLK